MNAASGGRARKGVYMRNLVESPPSFILAPLTCIEWLGASDATISKSYESFEADAQDRFSKSFESSGHSNAVSASFSGWGVSASASVSRAKEQSNEESIREKAMHNTYTKMEYHYDPVKSFQG